MTNEIIYQTGVKSVQDELKKFYTKQGKNQSLEKVNIKK